MRIRDMKGAKRSKRVREVLRCPHCGSDEIVYEAGLITGYKYYCKDCMYMGPLIIRDSGDADAGAKRPGRGASGEGGGGEGRAGESGAGEGGGGERAKTEARGKGKGSDGKG